MFNERLMMPNVPTFGALKNQVNRINLDNGSRLNAKKMNVIINNVYFFSMKQIFVFKTIYAKGFANFHTSPPESCKMQGNYIIVSLVTCRNL